MAKRGYWGDIIGSPYLAFGIESENKDLFKKSNGVYTKVRILNVAHVFSTGF